MRVQEHVTFSTIAAAAALPWLKRDTWIPWMSSLLIDVDHYAWHAIAHRTLSLRAALRYFGQADPPRLPQARFLHHPLVLAALLFLATRLRSRLLSLILVGLLFHVSLDVLHGSRLHHLKQSLTAQAQGICPACGKDDEPLQLHTVHFSTNPFERYAARHFVVLCPACHERAHSETRSRAKSL